MAVTVVSRSAPFGPDEALSAGRAAVGGKAHGLARLSAARLQVPPWFVLSTAMFREHLRDSGIDAAIQELLASLDVHTPDATPRGDIAGVSDRLRTLVEQADLDAELRLSIETARTALGRGPLAVRSSAIDEDGARHSFAGQLDTVLGVDDSEALMAAIRRCWTSAFSERVLDYRRRNGSLRGAQDIAVIVQRLVAGEVSGVMFTADPISGQRNRIRVSACLGLGDALVSGEIDADEYLLDRVGRVVEWHAGSERPAPVLDARALQTLASAGAAIEAAEGAPRDIEWTFAAGELWILQARPITNLPQAPAAGRSASGTADHRIVWDNSNIQESYCGVTTPLTFSFAQAAYATVYEHTMRALGIAERVIVRHRPLLRNLLGLIHGRVYYNLNNWYRGLLLLPSFRRNKADMERMMGVEEPVDFIPDEQEGRLARLRRIPGLVNALLRLSARFAMLDGDTRRFLARFESTMRSLDRASLPQQSLGELMAVLDMLQRECLDQWTTPIVNDFYVMMTVGRLRRLVERAVGEDADRVMQSLLGGADVTISAAPALLMLRMAEAARHEPAALDALRSFEGEEALRRATEASADLSQAYAELLSRFGDRCMGELKLESRPLRDDPAFVVNVLRNYLAGETTAPDALADRARQERDMVERDIRDRLRGIFAGGSRFRRTLTSARRAIRARETMRLARTRVFGAHRDVYRAIGAKLADAGRLDAAADVLFLTTGEIDSWWRGTATSLDLRSLARARQREFAAFESIDAPNRIITTGSPHECVATLAHSTVPADRDELHSTNAKVLRGLGCSPGIGQGRVRIVSRSSDNLSLSGHILVATRTDPGWAPLFPGAAAIIVERGSVLSHSAVLARELGLPAVVGIPGLTRTLREGELVRVDGTAGTIERLEEP